LLLLFNITNNKMKNGPEAVDNAIDLGIELDGTKIPQIKLDLYKKIQELESKRERSKASDCMRTRIVRSAHYYYSLEELNQELEKAGWERITEKEKKYFYEK